MTTTKKHRVEADDAWNEAFKEAMVRPVDQQATYLLATIGPRLTTAGLGMRDARQIKRWARDGVQPREADVEQRLRTLFRIVFAITRTYDRASVAAAFLRSANPQLDDQAPLLILSGQDPDQVQGPLLAATRAFLEG